MKKLLVILMLMVFFIPDPCPADQACQPIWDNVAGQTYILEVEDQSFDVEFSNSYCGPCPQGIVEIYDGIYIAPVLECTYMSGGDNFVYIDCGGDEITFILRGTKLELYVPSSLIMKRKITE